MKIVSSTFQNILIKTKNLVFAAGLLLMVIGAVMNPLQSIVGMSLRSISLYEFYFINILTRKKAKFHPQLKGFTNFFVRLLPELIWKSLVDAYELIGIAVGTVGLIYMIPGGGILGLVSISSSTITAPIALYMIGKSYLVLMIMLACLSSFFDAPLYGYLKLTPLVTSVAFAVVTNYAAGLILTAPIFAAAAYAGSVIPLFYFAKSAFNNISMTWSNESTNSDCLYYGLGTLSILLHLLEASCMIIGLSLGRPLFISGAKLLTSAIVQAPLLAATTLAATNKVSEDFCLNQTVTSSL
ncbi:hypothetical protein [Candidatus Synchoanobacter obligatus]|uniref:Stage II sporulation protein M n=1 Tax=Candidatus Synchoanobacter obligatus TaxID=2919597 RepID=A0ABT1L4W0_9GAMM|nr:hypothetical protein [Candidatus Synchoanobacter obligatus]MCP8351765.1 hypothetical protein [Candidatus Synchoanobacter obligatus]